MTAHYRLGVGVNNAFRSLPELRPLLLTALDAWGPAVTPAARRRGLELAVTRKQRAAAARIDEMVQFQLAAMYHEAHCDLIVFGSQFYRRRVLPGGELDYEELDGAAAASICEEATATRAGHGDPLIATASS